MCKKSPLKILFVTPSMKSGGGNRVFVELANLLKANFSQVSIIYPNNSLEKSHYQVDPDVTLIGIGKKTNRITTKLANAYAAIKAVRKILDGDKDVVSVISDPIFSIFYLVLPKKYKARTIRFMQADDYRIFDDLFVLKNKIILFIYKKLVLRSYLDVDDYFFNSKYTYLQFKKLAPNSKALLRLVHPGVNLDIFNNVNIRSKTELNICLVARKHPLKGFQDFIDAWDILDSGIKKMITKIFVISHDNLDNFKLPNNIELIVPQNDLDISKTMNSSHIFISTSWGEGFGLPPLEAMATGCAVVSSNSKGLLEYAVDGTNCLLFEPKNITELVKALSNIILDSTLREKIASRAEQDARHFTWENAANQFSEGVRSVQSTIKSPIKT